MDRRCVARENLETAALGLALMYPAYQWSVQQPLATTDISAHPI